MNKEHLKMIEDVTKELQESAERRGFINGQKAERERIKKELGKVLVFNKDIEDILSLTENNQHETN